MANIGRPPCGEGVIRSGKASAPGAPTSGQGHRRGLRRRFPHGHVRRAGLAMMSGGGCDPDRGQRTGREIRRDQAHRKRNGARIESRSCN